jgi:hypothetical protein
VVTLSGIGALTKIGAVTLHAVPALKLLVFTVGGVRPAWVW